MTTERIDRPRGGSCATRAARLFGVACAAVVGWSGSCGPAADGAGELPERVVLITLDTLRWDAFEGTGDEPPALARLAELAERGLVFERHYTSSSTTQPTHASLFTGLHPWRHGVVRNGIVLEGPQPTLAEVLADEGFWTGAVVASFPVTAQFGFGRGFSVYDEDFDQKYIDRWNDRPLEDGRFYRLADSVNAAALAMLEGAPAGDQFLWVHYFDPHEPYGDTSVPTPLRRHQLMKRIVGKPKGEPIKLDRLLRLYRQDVESLDEHLTGFIETLLADERYRTHVVLTADHGENLGEAGFIGHGQTLGEPEIHVPLLVFSPAAPAGRRADPCGSADVFTTTLALVGLEDIPSDGRNLLLAPPDAPVALGMRRMFVEEQRELLIDGTLLALEDYDFYLLDSERVVRGNGDAVAVDGVELSGDRQQDVRRLFRSIEEAVEALDSTEILDTETQDALKALGYAR